MMKDEKYTLADGIKLWENFPGGSVISQYISDELKLCSNNEELYRYRLHQLGLYVFFKHLYDICKSDHTTLHEFKELISELDIIKDDIPNTCVKVVKDIINDLNDRNLCPDWVTYLEENETNKSII